MHRLFAFPCFFFMSLNAGAHGVCGLNEDSSGVCTIFLLQNSLSTQIVSIVEPVWLRYSEIDLEYRAFLVRFPHDEEESVTLPVHSAFLQSTGAIRLKRIWAVVHFAVAFLFPRVPDIKAVLARDQYSSFGSFECSSSGCASQLSCGQSPPSVQSPFTSHGSIDDLPTNVDSILVFTTCRRQCLARLHERFGATRSARYLASKA